MSQRSPLLSPPASSTIAAWSFHPASHRLQCGHAHVTLTPTECRLLGVLLQWAPGAVVPRQALLEVLPGPPRAQGEADESIQGASPRHRALNMAVSRLRHKARQAGAILPLQTVSREGYALLTPIITPHTQKNSPVGAGLR